MFRRQRDSSKIMKFNIDLEDLSYIWQNLTDSQRLEVIKSIILLSNDNHGMIEKVKKMLDSEKFEEMVD